MKSWLRAHNFLFNQPIKLQENHFSLRKILKKLFNHRSNLWVQNSEIITARILDQVREISTFRIITWSIYQVDNNLKILIATAWVHIKIKKIVPLKTIKCLMKVGIQYWCLQFKFTNQLDLRFKYLLIRLSHKIYWWTLIQLLGHILNAQFIVHQIVFILSMKSPQLFLLIKLLARVAQKPIQALNQISFQVQFVRVNKWLKV